MKIVHWSFQLGGHSQEESRLLNKALSSLGHKIVKSIDRIPETC